MNAMVERVHAQLRPMREEDIAGVILIESRNYPFPWTVGIFRDCIRHGYYCWVYEGEAGSIIGYGVMSVAVGEAHILNLSIHPDCKGQGLGRRMMQHLLDQAREKGAEMAFLEVRPSNLPAIALYAGMGFNQVGIRRGYYPADDGREDALILALHLN